MRKRLTTSSVLLQRATSPSLTGKVIFQVTSKCLIMLKSRSLLCLIWFSATIHMNIINGERNKQAKSPLLQNKPFIAIWNAPTQQCRQRYKIDLDLSVFDIVANRNETLSGQNVTIFYHTHLGYYPYVTDNGESVHGGVPQNGSLEEHISKAAQDIINRIPDKDFQGLGVIDWENWRPQWDRNWGSKDIYREKSIKLVKDRHPDWPMQLLRKQAREEFDSAARNFMGDSVLLARDIRPQGLWGYYLFPDCYNYDYKQNPHSYTGQCPTIEIKRNDYLYWMWEYSNALFPSIYLDYVLQSSTNAKKFVHHRLKEAARVASMSKRSYELPIYAYARPFYSLTLHTLSQIDLVHTIGESAAMGAAGVVLWGGSDYSSTPDSCNLMKKFIDRTFGHYIVNVTKAAKLCSKVLCNKNGRCLRKHQDSAAYLHLNPKNFKIKPHSSGKGHYVTGYHGKEDVHYMKQKFVCQCFEGWTGMFCEFPQLEDLHWKTEISYDGPDLLFHSFSYLFYALLQIIIFLNFYN